MNYNPGAIIRELLNERKKHTITSLGAFNRDVVDYCRARQAAEQTGENYIDIAGSFHTTPTESPEAVAAYDNAFGLCQRLADAYEIDASKASKLQTVYFMLLQRETSGFDHDAFVKQVLSGRETVLRALEGLELPRIYAEVFDMGALDFIDKALESATVNEGFVSGLYQSAANLKERIVPRVRTPLLQLAYSRGVDTALKAHQIYPLPADPQKINELKSSLEGKFSRKKKSE